MTKWTRGIYVMLTIILFQSCLKDFQDVEELEIQNWQPEMAVALVNTTVSIADILDNFDDQGFLEINADNTMTLVHQGEIFSITGEEIVEIPDFSVPMLIPSVTIPYAMLNMPNDIDFFTMKSGVFEFGFQSNHLENIDVVIEFTNLTKGGQVFEYSTNAIYNGSSPVNVGESIDLNDYIMDFSSDEISVSYTATNQQGLPVLLDNFVILMRDIKYDFAQGNFNQYAFDLNQDTIRIDLFEKAIGGSIEVEDPKIKLVVTNSFGVPIEFKAENIVAETIDEGTMSVYSVLDAGVDFNFPSLTEVGQDKITNIDINKDNSNINEIISSGPKEFSFEMSALANPDNDPTIKGFLKDDSQFKVDMEVEVPVYMSASGFTIEEKSEFDSSFFEDVENAEFKLITENGLPVEADVQVYFLDVNDMVLDSLFNDAGEKFIESAEVDGSGNVTSSTISEKIAEVSENRIQNFRNATQIAIRGSISTAQNGTVSVRFFTDHEMNFKLGVKAKLQE